MIWVVAFRAEVIQLFLGLGCSGCVLLDGCQGQVCKTVPL